MTDMTFMGNSVVLKLHYNNELPLFPSFMNNGVVLKSHLYHQQVHLQVYE